MGEPSAKKQKTGTKPPDHSTGPRITDPRFANIQSDPRYRLPGKRNKVKLDKRFSRVLQDEDFTKRAKVDRYGRPIESKAEKNRLKRKYEFDEDEAGNELDDDEEVQRELGRVDKARDPLREGRDTESSSDETSSDEESEVEEDVDEEGGVGPTEQNDVPTGEVTSRIAIVNLDWDNIRATDLMVVFTSFLPPSGALLKVAIYPSEFGKERLEREEMEGPPREIFADADKNGLDDNSESEGEEDIRKAILQPQDGSEFDPTALRRYQLERLRYFYGILTFSSPSVAKHIYDAVDGTEYLRTANFFDLRFVPDDTDFSTDIPKEECDKIPDDYRPNEFITDALQHSKVKLTWDTEDGSRKEAVARAFRGGKKEIDENDLKAYLGSDSSDEEDEQTENMGASTSRKEAERQRMRALLGLAPEPEKKSSKKNNGPVGDMQVTFTSGLSGSKEDGKEKKKSVFENSPEPEETTVDKYVRKERERKQKRKEKMKAAREGISPDPDAEHQPTQFKPAHGDHQDGEEEREREREDLGFDDPFFASAAPSGRTAEKTASKTKLSKQERLKKKQERDAAEEADRKQRAELELLMADDDEGHVGPNKKMRHFDMKEIERAEKAARKKSKSKQQKLKASATTLEADEFKMDTADPRFARLFESHEYAIDPTNPRFKGTKGMRELLDEGRKRKGNKGEGGRVGIEKGGKGRGDTGALERGKGKGVDGRTMGEAGDVKSLVEKIKRQNQK